MFDFTRPLFGISHAPEENVLEEVSRTQLGRDLLAFLHDHKVDIRFEHVGSGGGAFSGEENKLYVSSDLSFAEKMHVFAHEARHAMQYHNVRRQAPSTSASVNPLGVVYNERLGEMDAEAFAVFFVHHHCDRTKRDYFDALAGTSTTSTPLAIGEWPLYRTFAKALAEGGETAAMRTAFEAFPLLQYRIDYYAGNGLGRWEAEVYRPLCMNSRDPNGAFATAFRASVSRRQSCTDFIAERAKGYSAMCPGWGVPDYLSGAKPEEFIPIIAGNVYPAPFKDQQEHELKQARRDFRRMVKRYFRRAPKGEPTPRGAELSFRLWGL